MDNKKLIELGFTQGPWIPACREAVERLDAHEEIDVQSIERSIRNANPKWQIYEQIPLSSGADLDKLKVFCNPENDLEVKNVDDCIAAMKKIMQSPVVNRTVLMPDCCPTGPNSVPVGGVVESTHLHPAFHSADACCSLAATNFGSNVDPKALLDAAHESTHFGFGETNRDGRIKCPKELMNMIKDHPLLKRHAGKAEHDFATQGDGNHFLSINIDPDNGDVYLITHHGSRGLGSRFYKDGNKFAEEYTSKVCPDLPKGNAWIPRGAYANDYWEGLQCIREWTKQSHYAIHDAASHKLSLDSEIKDRFWNEHNFVFKKDDLFYHAKGATPAYSDWAYDSTTFTIIPLNMGQPILIVKGLDHPESMGFSPHGAGRNMSRTQHKKEVLIDGVTIEDVLKRETEGLDCRFYSGKPDISELPSSYKNADQVTRDIEHFGLAEIHKKLIPYGCIMNGESPDWRRFKKRRKNNG